MNLSLASAPSSLELQARRFFQETAGRWHSERRYYTLKSDKLQEGVSLLDIQFLEPDSLELIQLAQMHQLGRDQFFICGAKVDWDSQDAQTAQPTSRGSCIFGIYHDTLYRDRSFAKQQPLVSTYRLPQDRTFVFRTEYDGSLFEEECRLIGTCYRTRQLIAFRSGEAEMVGQYFEKRVN